MSKTIKENKSKNDTGNSTEILNLVKNLKIATDQLNLVVFEMGDTIDIKKLDKCTMETHSNLCGLERKIEWLLDDKRNGRKNLKAVDISIIELARDIFMKGDDLHAFASHMRSVVDWGVLNKYLVKEKLDLQKKLKEVRSRLNDFLSYKNNEFTEIYKRLDEFEYGVGVKGRGKKVLWKQ